MIEQQDPTSAEDPHTPASAAEATEAIEAAGPGDVSDDEFDPQEFDGRSVADSTSVTSSLFEHAYENGRRYHAYKNARYPIPNDDIEQNREDMKHAMMLELTDGKLFFAPIGDNPQKIIDLGTGTGIWAIDVADQFPSAEVLGIDFTPIQPSWVPPNLKFIVDDIEEDWLNGSGFDLVHLRQIFPVLKKPDKVLRQSYENLKPGGWIEVQELGGKAYCDDASIPENYSIQEFLDKATEAFKKFGNNFRIGNEMDKHLEKAGFTNISVRKLKVPIGPWPKDKRLRLIGMYFQNILGDLLGAIGARPFQVLGMDPVEIQVFLAGVRKDIKNTNYHSYLEYLFWTAQKPE
ncbi:S-adenosyl-L-methionine-dependent methyltransferase [Achaetomium macrosporum]|uniref:S-adenosyl-L-methionine-dependent methyltransferase n=1 Tax=Achaetomium macrosporum TaxID=79813 RepID=A0AAN7HAW2_9PEZI|nr:S-adenosyl-L-methionine-dependent methyltransferase [Achaetomium macrosporum]